MTKDNVEIWKDCKGYDGKYQISNKGRIWSVSSNRVLSLNERSGYLGTILIKPNGKRQNEHCHRLVALAFLDNPNNLPQVNHIDENKHNNNVENLEWCSSYYNMTYGEAFKIAAEKRKKVLNQYDKKGNFIKQWESLKEASETLGISKGNISECCNGKRNFAGGYAWSYNN